MLLNAAGFLFIPHLESLIRVQQRPEVYDMGR